MIDIGIIGDKNGMLERALGRFFPYAAARHADRVQKPQQYDILIIGEAAGLDSLEGEGEIFADITLLNSDSRGAGAGASRINPGQIVTYGFNGKSCITASSVGENSVLICIQRILFTLSGEPIMPQELKAEHDEGWGDIRHHLGAYACGAVCGFARGLMLNDLAYYSQQMNSFK